MKTLGIDYGKKKAGIAIGVGTFAEPLMVIRFENLDFLKKEIAKLAEKENIDRLVVGISEGEMAEESAKFAREIGAETFDETLTTKDAQRLSLEGGVKRNKRREFEDAYAASVMLQNYLDSRA